MFKYYYKTPDNFSNLVMISDGTYLTGLWFDKLNDELKNYKEKLLPVFEDTIEWLDIYFSGKVPNFNPSYKLENITDFQKEVIKHMLQIPFGTKNTYGEIAKKIASERKTGKMSSQAVGHAASKNPICIIIPCHRVLGQDNKIIGYSGGINNKIALLKHEGIILN